MTSPVWIHPCNLPVAAEVDVRSDKEVFGRAYIYYCECGRAHRLPPERVVIEYQSEIKDLGMIR